MNITAFTIYLWQLADSLSSAMFLLVMSLLVAAFFTWLYALCDDESFIPMAKKFTAAAVLGLALNTLIPSSNTIAMMVVIPGITNSKVIQQDVPELYDIAIKSLKEKINPMKEEDK